MSIIIIIKSYFIKLSFLVEFKKVIYYILIFFSKKRN